MSYPHSVELLIILLVLLGPIALLQPWRSPVHFLVGLLVAPATVGGLALTIAWLVCWPEGLAWCKPLVELLAVGVALRLTLACVRL